MPYNKKQDQNYAKEIAARVADKVRLIVVWSKMEKEVIDSETIDKTLKGETGILVSLSDILEGVNSIGQFEEFETALKQVHVINDKLVNICYDVQTGIKFLNLSPDEISDNAIRKIAHDFESSIGIEALTVVGPRPWDGTLIKPSEGIQIS